MTREEGQVHLVLGVDGPVQFHVHVIEVKGVVLEVLRGLQQQVHIRPPRCHQQRGLVFRDRTLQRTLRREQSHARPTMPATPVSSPARDVEHCRRCPAILGRQQTLVEGRRGQGVFVERGEQTGQVTGVIDGCQVEEHLVLGRRASSHLETARGVALRLHTRQQLDAPHDIRLSEQLWGRGQVLYLDHLRTRLHVLDALTRRVRRHHHLLQPLCADGVLLRHRQGQYRHQ